MLEFTEKIGSFLWTPVMLIILLGFGIILTFRFKFFQFVHTKKIYKETVATLFIKKNLSQKSRYAQYISNTSQIPV